MPDTFVAFFSSEFIDGHLRPVLQQRLVDSLEMEDFDGASVYLSAFIDTWPVGGSSHKVPELWKKYRDEMALAILYRGKEIASLLGEELEIELRFLKNPFHQNQLSVQSLQ